MRLRNMVIIIHFLIIILLILPGCGSMPEGVSDYEQRPLDTPINSIKDGIPYAKGRTLDWGKTAFLEFIVVWFEGREQIEKRKGDIIYSLTAIKDDNSNLLAQADVFIDMNKNVMEKFRVYYDPRQKELKLSESEKRSIISDLKDIKTDNWIIDINEAFEIASKELGQNKILQYENPKVILRCFEDIWVFEVYSKVDALLEEWIVVINPETGKTIKVEDKTKK